MGLSAINFQIVKHTDRVILASLDEIATENNLTVQSCNVQLDVGGVQITQTSPVSEDASIKYILDLNDEQIRSESVQYRDNEKKFSLPVTISRNKDQRFDTIVIKGE